METEPSPTKTKITIGGLSGTGKGTVATRLANQLGFTSVSAGDFFRALVKERGFASLLDFQKVAHTDPSGDTSIDEAVDARTKEYGANHNHFVIEGRLCAHVIPDAFKILLTCDEHRFERVAGREQISVALAKEQTLERERLYNQFYQRFYGIEDYLDPKYYDMVIDTSSLLPEAIVERIINEIT